MGESQSKIKEITKAEITQEDIHVLFSTWLIVYLSMCSICVKAIFRYKLVSTNLTSGHNYIKCYNLLCYYKKF